MKVALLLILCWNIRDSQAIPSYTGEQLGTFTVEGQYVFSRLQHSGYHVTPVFLDISGFNFDSYRFDRHLEIQVDILAWELYFHVFLENSASEKRYQDIDTANLHRISIRVH